MTTVLSEKAHMFFRLLNDSYKLEASEKLQWMSIVSVPHMNKPDVSRLRQAYINQSEDVLDRFESPGDVDIKKLKEILHG